MSYAAVTYTGDGSTTDYAIPFAYTDEADVVVTVDGASASYTFSSSSLITFATAPASGAKVFIERDTDDDARDVVWDNGVALTKDQLNNAMTQVFYMAQEAKAITARAMYKNYSGNFDAGSVKIINLADPTDDQDAATKVYVDGLFTPYTATISGYVDAASASATSAATSETNAATTYDAFDDRYLGDKASDPSVDNDGNALLTGALYWNTTTDKMRVWRGAAWQDIGIDQGAVDITGGTIDSVYITGGTVTGAAVSGGTVSGSAISGGTVSGLTSDLAIDDGGTAASTKEGAANSLEVVSFGVAQTLTTTEQTQARANIGGAAPAGEVAYFAMSTAPTGWLKANGATVSRTTYADLFAAISTTWGAGDGSTTFKLPDLRGEFVRGWDDARGIDSGRVFASSQADAFKSHNHDPATGTAFWTNGLGIVISPGSGYNFSVVANTASTGGSETRPRNIALLACIKY